MQTSIWFDVYNHPTIMTSDIPKPSTTPEDEPNPTIFDSSFIRMTLVVLVLAFVVTALVWFICLASWRGRGRDEHQEIPLVVIRQSENGNASLERLSADERAILSSAH
jgi:hypothetical protein